MARAELLLAEAMKLIAGDTLHSMATNACAAGKPATAKKRRKALAVVEALLADVTQEEPDEAKAGKPAPVPPGQWRALSREDRLRIVTEETRKASGGGVKGVAIAVARRIGPACPWSAVHSWIYKAAPKVKDGGHEVALAPWIHRVLARNTK